MEDDKTTSSYSGQFIKDCKEHFQNVSAHLLQNSKISEEEAHGSQQYHEPLLLKFLNFGEDEHLRFENALCSP